MLLKGISIYQSCIKQNWVLNLLPYDLAKIQEETVHTIEEYKLSRINSRCSFRMSMHRYNNASDYVHKTNPSAIVLLNISFDIIC